VCSGVVDAAANLVLLLDLPDLVVPGVDRAGAADVFDRRSGGGLLPGGGLSEHVRYRLGYWSLMR